MESNYATILKGSKNLLCAHGWVGQTQLSYWRRISQSEIRNSAVAEKSDSESEGGQKFLPPQPPSFLPARAFSFLLRLWRNNQSELRSKKVRASFSNCDQSRHFKFSGERACLLAPPSAGLRSHFSAYFRIKS